MSVPALHLVVCIGQLYQLNVRSPSCGADLIFEGADPFTRPVELLPVYRLVVGECVADIPVHGINDIDSFRQVPQRSEEHTSELQSRGHLVCRLLLESKIIRSAVLMRACATRMDVS